MITPFSSLYYVFLGLELGQNGAQKSPPVLSATFCTWRMSRVRIGHACASLGEIPFHAYASVTRTRCSSSALGTRVRRPCVRVAASFPKLHFLAFLPLLHVSFPSSKPFLPYKA
ncbi:uncharacterized protein DS421_18g615900 [Arachis hypogaea]|nr:uncharacterized protein DS421_18g615900 [Arachis hypogaea]